MSVISFPTARVFEPLLVPARYKGAYGGRASAKSHFFAGAIVERCILQPGLRAVCIREVQKDLRESAKHLIETKIEAAERQAGGRLGFRVTDRDIRTPGGGLILFQGMQDHTAQSIKSLEDFALAWGEEAQTMSRRSLELLRPTIRAPGSELWFSWNPTDKTDAIDQMFRGAHPPTGAVSVMSNWSDNPWLPDEMAQERVDCMRDDPVRYAHIWEGDYEPMIEGAIWTRQVLHDCRRSEVPTLARIAVAVDPAVTSGEHADEHGIMVGGVGQEDNHGYLVDDVSLRGSPRQWAERAVAAFDRYEADTIIIEVNQGGDMVRQTLESVRRGLPITEVRATRGKHVRAEPVSSLYAMGRIHHVGTFPELEAQMCQMTSAGYEGKGSPDRVDALVWLFTELFPKVAPKSANSGRTFSAQTDFEV